jgi:hypothetical protein
MLKAVRASTVARLRMVLGATTVSPKNIIKDWIFVDPATGTVA